MTADVLILHSSAGGSLYNTICLSPAYRLISAGVLGENKFMVIWITFVEIIFQSIGGIVVKSDIVTLAGLLLVDKKISAKFMMFEIVNVVPL